MARRLSSSSVSWSAGVSVGERGFAPVQSGVGASESEGVGDVMLLSPSVTILMLMAMWLFGEPEW